MSSATTAAAAPRRIRSIAEEIDRRWPRVSYAARPYLTAMKHLDHPTCTYGTERADTIVLRFLDNARGWRGDDARRLKAELRARFGWK